MVLPGQGSFKSCIDALNKIDGLIETLNETVIIDKKPLLGIALAYKCLLILVMKKPKQRFELDFRQGLKNK